MPTFRLRVRHTATLAREATADIEAPTLTEAMDLALQAARAGDLVFDEEEIDRSGCDVVLVGIVQE
jgi:hypothetical protein